MKIYKLLFLTVLSCFALSCSQDSFEDKTIDDTNERLAASQFDDSHLGLYKGLFSTNDGLTRGSVVITMSPTNEAIAQITLSTGEVVELKSSRVKLTADNSVDNLRFSSAGLSNIDASLSFSVQGDGTNPAISGVRFDNQDSDILIAKNLSRAPLNTITGTYMRTAGTGGFPTSGRTWNVMSVGRDNQTYSTQIFYGGRIYNTTDSSNQTSCSDNGDGTDTCDIDGSATILGYPVTWTGTHVYDNFLPNDNVGCSQVDGTWSAPSYGGSSGTFTSDSDCSGIFIVNDTCGSATSISCGDSATGQTVGASNSDAPADCGDATNMGAAAGVWYTYDTEVGNITFDTFGSDYDTKIAVYAGSCGALVCIAGNDDAAGGLQSEVGIISPFAGQTLYIYVTGFNAAEEGSYVLNVTCEPFLTCGDALVDDGGVAGNYALDTNTFYVVDAGAGNRATVDFTVFQTENGWDDLIFFDGILTGGSIIGLSDLGTSASGPNGGFTGTELLGDSVSSTGQFLTIVFVSDDINNDIGFEGTVSCTPARNAQVQQPEMEGLYLEVVSARNSGQDKNSAKKNK